MKVLTAARMAAFDRRCIEDRGVPGLLLMEHAGRLTARVAGELRPEGPGVAVVLCGGGNNGGDGYVAARHLAAAGWQVRLVALRDPETLTGDAAVMARLAVTVAGLRPRLVAQSAQAPVFAGAHLVVDAVLGTGLSGPPRGPVRAVLEALNESGLPVVACDLPSGLSADSGEPLEVAARAAVTVTMGLPKVGFFTTAARSFLGHLLVADIGFPRDELTTPDAEDDVRLVVAGVARAWLPPRPRDVHKGRCGRVLVVGGSRGMVGAAALAALGALRAGAGLVRLAVPASLRSEAAALAPEVMTVGLPDGDGALTAEATPVVAGLAGEADSMVLGPGLGRTGATAAFVAGLLSAVGLPLVVDADGLALLPGEAMDRPAVLTPHPGEAGRLAGLDTAAVQADRRGVCRRLAAARAAVVVLKGAHTLTGGPSGTVWVNPTGNPAMATAGAGDVLAGVTGAFLAETPEDPARAGALAAYVHGLAGDLAPGAHPARGLVAGDLASGLPRAFEALAAVEPAGDGAYPATVAADGLAVIR